MLSAQSSARADEGRARLYELPNLDSLELAVPSGWQDFVDQPPDGGPPTIELRPCEGTPFEVQITPDWPDSLAATAEDPEALRAMARDAAERAAIPPDGGAVEIRRLQGASGVGFYFVAVESSPPAGEFKFMHQGVLQVGGLTVTFTILSGDSQEGIVEQALAMLAGAVHHGTGLDQR